MTWFRRRGRKAGGIHILVAPPSEGKSYIVTEYAEEFLRTGKRKVFSNYPIRSRDGKYCSLVFEKGLMHENLNGAVIILDEAHRYFWSRDFKHFTQFEKDWFSTCGHNEITVYVLTQALARIDVIIVDAATLIWDIQKTEIPLFEIPLFFTITQFASKEQYIADEKMIVAKPPYDVFRIWFKQGIADMYDTTYFKIEGGEPFKGIRWDDYYKSKGKTIKPPYPTKFQILIMLIKEKYRFVTEKIKREETKTELEIILERMKNGS